MIGYLLPSYWWLIINHKSRISNHKVNHCSLFTVHCLLFTVHLFLPTQFHNKSYLYRHSKACTPLCHLRKSLRLLGAGAESLLNHQSKTISKEHLHLRGPDFLDRIFAPTNRSNQVIRSLRALYGHGRLKDAVLFPFCRWTRGIEHSYRCVLRAEPDLLRFDPENIVKLAIEGGCNAVASTYGVLASVSRKYAHKIPFIVKINLTVPFRTRTSSTRSCSAPCRKPGTWALSP